MCALAALTGCFSLPAIASGTLKRHRNARGHPAQKRRVFRRRSCVGAGLVPDAANVAMVEQATLCLVNRERGAHGLPALADNRALHDAAAEHSADMVVRDYFSHRSPAGATVEARDRTRGYARAGTPVSVGENVATAGGEFATPANVVRGWMRSPGHRANVLARSFHATGVGIVLGMPLCDASGWHGPGATYTEDLGSYR
jgi:uncharacterized protein YkwD